MPRVRDYPDVVHLLDAVWPKKGASRRGLDWRRLRHDAGWLIYVADISPQRASAILRAFSDDKKDRLPKLGYTRHLAIHRDKRLYLENRGGEYCLMVV